MSVGRAYAHVASFHNNRHVADEDFPDSPQRPHSSRALARPSVFLRYGDEYNRYISLIVYQDAVLKDAKIPQSHIGDISPQFWQGYIQIAQSL
jgi:hypothetical protein